jgi:hypothetical protein
VHFSSRVSVAVAVTSRPAVQLKPCCAAWPTQCHSLSIMHHYAAAAVVISPTQPSDGAVAGDVCTAHSLFGRLTTCIAIMWVWSRMQAHANATQSTLLDFHTVKADCTCGPDHQGE